MGDLGIKFWCKAITEHADDTTTVVLVPYSDHANDTRLWTERTAPKGEYGKFSLTFDNPMLRGFFGLNQVVDLSIALNPTLSKELMAETGARAPSIKEGIAG